MYHLFMHWVYLNILEFSEPTLQQVHISERSPTVLVVQPPPSAVLNPLDFYVQEKLKTLNFIFC